MSKQGIYKISGNTKPKVGELVTYKIDEWYPATPKEKRNPALVTWHLFKKENGKFVPTNIKKKGISSFTFNSTAYKDTFRIEAYLHSPEGKAPMALVVQPQPSDVPRINKVELKYVDNTPGTVFNFTEKLVAEAKCMNLEGQYLQFTLWEDDAKDAGHHNKNLLIDSKKEKVINGTARAEFTLTHALMKKAMEGETDPQQLQFYVTVEYYSNKKHATNNVNINTPEELRTPPSQPQPQPQPQPQQPAPAPEQPIEPQTAHGQANNTQPATPPISGGVSPTIINPVKTEDLLDAYFAKKEYTRQTGEEDGTHTYTFGGSKSGNKTVTAEEKNKVAQTILGKIKDSLKSQKKYTTLEVIAAALTAEAYGKDTVNQKTVTFKTFKLGADFKKVDSAPLDDKLYLVARTMLLDGKQVTISIKEKDGIIKGTADAVLPVLEITEEQMAQKTPAGQAVPGTEKTVFTGTVKDNMVKIPIHLRPKSEEELKQWKDKISKGKEDGTYTYTFGSATNIDNETKKTSIAKIILDNAKKGNVKNPKIENGKSSSEEEIKKALAIKNYQAGDTITFKLLKKVPEFLYLHAKAQGEKQYDKKFLNKEGAYFQIGNKCPRCEAEITLKDIETAFDVYSNQKDFRQKIVDSLNKFIKQRKNEGKDLHLNTCLRKAHFFAQVAVETLGIHGDWIIEGKINHSVESAKSAFGERARTLERNNLLSAYCQDRPQKRLLNYMYALGNGFDNGNGNEASGDGWKFRGRGLKQITGRGNYKVISEVIKEIFPVEYNALPQASAGEEKLVSHPEKVEEIDYAVITALAFWEKHKIWELADTIPSKTSSDNDFKKIRQKVVGESAFKWKVSKDYFQKTYDAFRVSECSPGEEKASGGKWHDPVDNPRCSLYMQNGGDVEPLGKIWGLFGKDIRKEVSRPHTGLDLFAKTGTNIYACVDGTVYHRCWHGGYGNTVTIKVNDPKAFMALKRQYTKQTTREQDNGSHWNENGDIYLFYGHLDSVKEFTFGQAVNCGDILGTTGRSGVTAGTKAPHLHFEIFCEYKMLVGTNYRINPAYFVNYKTYENQSEAERREQEQEKNRGVIKEVNGKQKLTHYNLSTFQK